jgi:hypothetical protein
MQMKSYSFTQNVIIIERARGLSGVISIQLVSKSEYSVRPRARVEE